MSVETVEVFYLYDPVNDLYYKGSGIWVSEMQKAKMYRGRGMASNAAATYKDYFKSYEAAWSWTKIAREQKVAKPPQIKDLEILKFELHTTKNFVEKFKPKCSERA